MGPKKRKLEEDAPSSVSSQIINMYDIIPEELKKKQPNPNFALHHLEIPFRMIVVAPSGSGKTNFLINLIKLFCEGRGTFKTIQIITRNKAEPLYEWLESKTDQIKITEGLHTLPDLDRFDKTKSHLICLDDLVLSRDLTPVVNYYIRCRKLGVSIVFLSQSFYTIPKVIRSNCNYVILLKLSGDREIRMILSEYGLGVSKDELLQIYHFATSEKFSPLVIDIDAGPENKFRKGLLEVIHY
jgi:hypothetical protein